MNARADAVAQLEATLGHIFQDRALLERALTHSSVGDGARSAAPDNERLEFLGDRVLGLLAAEHLMSADPAAREGDLAPRLNALVNRGACARVARRLGLSAALRLSAAETKAGGRDKESILGDACEALIAAIYQDGGLEAARRVFAAAWSEEIDRLGEPRSRDAKTVLQEWAQSLGLPLPAYRVVGRAGLAHAPVFAVEVEVQGLAPAQGSGSSRQAAEKAAAQVLVDREGAR